MSRRPIRVGELTSTSANRFAQLHHGRRLHVELDDPDTTVACDPVLLRRAVDNLLDNAAKYSEPATEVDLRVRKSDDQLEVVIADHGVGMSDDELAHAFTPFWRARAAPEASASASPSCGASHARTTAMSSSRRASARARPQPCASHE